MDPQHHRYSLKWNEFQSHVSNAFESLREQEAFTDITLGCEGKVLKAHRVVLCASSPYLRQLLEGHESGHPIVFLKDVNHMDMEAILDFIYTGAVDLDQAQLQSFLSTAEALQIKGLTKADTLQDINDKNSRLPAPQPTNLDNLSRDSPPAKRPYKESSSSEEEERIKKSLPLALTDQNLNNVSSLEDMNIHCEEEYGIHLQLPVAKYEGDNFPLNASIPVKKRAKIAPVPSVLEKKDSNASQYKNNGKGCSEFVFNQRIVRGSRAGISKYGLSPDLKCSQCDKVFVHAASLIKHRSFHEGNTVCPFCNRVYSHKYTLREHVIREHGNRAHEVPSIAFKKTALRTSLKEMPFVPKAQSIVKSNLSESGSPDSPLPSLISIEDLSIKKEVTV